MTIEMPACLRAFGSVRNGEPDVGRDVREGSPDLLTVDHPLVTVEFGLRAQRGEVRAPRSASL